MLLYRSNQAKETQSTSRPTSKVYFIWCVKRTHTDEILRLNVFPSFL